MTVCFTFNWMDVAPSPDMTMGQTMAQLSIEVKGETVTSVRDRSSGARRGHIVVPLLSVAEWLVGNWCHIWHEIPDTTADIAKQKPGFERRHNLAFAGDGFLFPKLTMVPSVNGMQQLRWTPWQPQHARIEFVGEGQATVARDQLQRELERIVEAVLERLGRFPGQGSVVSDLEDSWNAIQTLDPDEHEFCHAAALLGVDPFAVPQEVAEAIAAFWEHTEPALREDMLASLEETNLPKASPWLDHTREMLEHQDTGNEKEWAAIRCGISDGLPAMQMAKPWEQGYALARSLRRGLDYGDGRFDFAAPGQPVMHHQETDMPFSRVEGLVAAGAPACVIPHRKGATQQRFLLARALGDYMGRGSEPGLGILTSMETARQARSRAFAAELLAPAESLRSRLAGQGVTEDVARTLGQEFDVSPWVIHHQVRNHGLEESNPLTP